METISKVEAFITSTIFAVALIVLAVNIFLRYFFKSSTTWAEEAMRYIMIWITFFGASLCVESDLHVGIDIFVQMAPPLARKMLKLFAQMCGVFFSGYMVIFGMQSVIFLVNSAQKSSVMLVPMWIVYFCMPLGGFFTLLRYIQKLVFYFKKPSAEYADDAENSEKAKASDIDILTLS